MNQILREVGQLFLEAIPTVIFVGLLAFVLERLFFGPVAAVLKKREEATSGALARAREQSALAEAKAQEYDASWQKTRQEIYRVRERDRRRALVAREEMIRRAHEQAESLVIQAGNALTTQAEAVRAELAQRSSTLAEQIAEVILGRREPGSEPGEVAR